MEQLWLFYNDYYQQLSMPFEKSGTITIGPEMEQLVTIREFPFTKGPVTIERHDRFY